MGNPSTIPPQREPLFPDRIPTELRQGSYFVGWRWQQRNDKWTKPLFNVRCPQSFASSTDPTTWGTFEHARAAYNAGEFHGIGRVLAPGDGDLGGIDLDDCWDNQRKNITDKRAEEIVRMIPTYWEISPSLTGLRGIGFVNPEIKSLPGIHRGKYEIYFTGRYLTLTGRTSAIYSRPPSNISKCVKSVYEMLEQERACEPITDRASFGKSNLSDVDVVRRIATSAQAEKFKNLFRGNWQTSYRSQSEADLALCSILSFWCGKDADQINRIFKQSKLYRGKWDRQDYQIKTISLACGQQLWNLK